MKTDFMNAMGVAKFIDTSFVVGVPQSLALDYVAVELPEAEEEPLDIPLLPGDKGAY